MKATIALLVFYVLTLRHEVPVGLYILIKPSWMTAHPRPSFDVSECARPNEAAPPAIWPGAIEAIFVRLMMVHSTAPEGCAGPM